MQQIIQDIKGKFGHLTNIEYILSSIIFYEQVVKTIKNEFGNKNIKILDAGCSHGYGSYLMANICDKWEIIGIDINKQIISTAQKLVKKKNINFKTVDLTDKKQILEFIDKYGKFDAITCFEVFEHIPPKKSEILLENLNLLLKEGGFLFISTPNKMVYDIFAFTDDHINELEYRKFLELIQKNFRITFIFGCRAYSWRLIRTLWKFGLVSRDGDTKIHFNLWQKFLRKLFMILLAPYEVYLWILKRISYQKYLTALCKYNSLNKHPDRSSLVFIIAKKSCRA
jgi:2-polyprenyl-3-methyl-5-hydroxy-6-metoxy-1,4-benzoquinol methylase